MTQNNETPKPEDNAQYLDYVQPLAASEALARLTQLASEQAKAEAEVARIEAELQAAKDALKVISETSVPELMDELGMTSFKTASGLTVDIKETIRASIPKNKQPLAFNWLREHGNAALIRRVISLPFGKGEDERAQEVMDILAQEGLHPDDVLSVHPSTLSAFVKEKLEKGEEIPTELFGVFRQRVSKVKPA